MPQVRLSLLVIFTTLFVFLFTKNPMTGPFKLQLTLLALVGLLVYGYIIRKTTFSFKHQGLAILSLIFILFLVGSTGWFFSPFFFTLYLSVILLAFIFSLPVSLSFAVTLVTLFAFNIGEVDLTYDFLVVLSLLTTIPLSIYLREEYLKLKESEKKILVLRQEKEEYKNKIEEVLANKVTNFSVNLRQPINDIKQLAYRLQKLNLKKDINKYEQRIILSSEEAIRMVKDFEEEVTGKKLTVTPKTLLRTLPTDQDSNQT